MALYDNPPFYISAYGLAVRQGFVGSLDEWLESLKGDSAYEVAVSQGFTGSVTDWLNSLAGPPGPPGAAGAGSGDMLCSVYDPGGRARDVFAYTDSLCDAVADVIGELFAGSSGGTGSSGGVITGTGTGSISSGSAAGAAGVTDHRALAGLDAPDQHPISAITGLTAALAAKMDAGAVGQAMAANLQVVTQQDVQDIWDGITPA